MIEHGQQPFFAGAALTHPSTRDALARYRRYWSRVVKISMPLLALSAIGFVILFSSTGTDDDEPNAGIALGLTAGLLFAVWGLGMLGGGAYMLWRANRMQEILAQFPWHERHRYRLQVGKGVAIYIDADSSGPPASCVIDGGPLGRSWIRRLRAIEGRLPIVVAGDPYRLAVMATPDMQFLYILKPL